MATNQTAIPARIIENGCTKNGFLVEQVVRTETNGSRYKLVGSDMLKDGRVGDRVMIHPMARGYAHRQVSHG